MRPPSIWTVLGVTADSDELAIRRAYARKLRATNPEDNPDDFKALREAYEVAMGHAAQRRFNDQDMVDKSEEDVGSTLSPGVHMHATSDVSEQATIGGGDRNDRSDTGAINSGRIDPPTMQSEALRERMAFEALFNRFQASLEADAPHHGSDMFLLLKALLAHPAMDQLLVRNAAEEWIATAIAFNSPRSDPVVDLAIGHFGWSNANYRQDSHSVAMVLARVDQVGQMDAFSAPSHELHRGWRVLMDDRPPSLGMKLSARLPGVPDQVRTLLSMADRFYGMDQRWNPARILWWRRHLAQPRVVLGTTGLLILLKLLSSLIATPWADQKLASDLITLLGMGLLPLYARFVKHPPDLPGQEPPAGWRRWWIIIPILPLPVAALVPANPIGTAIVAALALAALLSVLALCPPRISTTPLPANLLSLARRYWMLGLFAFWSMASLEEARAEQWFIVALISLIVWERGLPGIQPALISLLSGRWMVPVICVIAALPTATALLPVVQTPLSETCFRISLAVLFGQGFLLASNIMHGTHYGRPSPGFLYAILIALWLGFSFAAVDKGRDQRQPASPAIADAMPFDQEPSNMTEPALAPAPPKPTTIAAKPKPVWQPSPCPPIDDSVQGPVQPVPCGSESNWIGSDDYPETAIRRQAEGKVKAQAVIDTDGRVRNCTITTSSGHADLDKTVCALLEQRARFNPARNAQNEEIPTDYKLEFTWRINR
ncbi:TonB family protein [Rhizorhabdus sp. FW153]|uniref:TonB family protein n=1 Tax=Rhizorhabdus sp. FW153 TaxID=3400216 RepID=UPI003CF67C43